MCIRDKTKVKMETIGENKYLNKLSVFLNTRRQKKKEIDDENKFSWCCKNFNLRML